MSCETEAVQGVQTHGELVEPAAVTGPTAQDHGYLTNMAVAPSHRRQGLGGIMLQVWLPGCAWPCAMTCCLCFSVKTQELWHVV